MNFLTLNEELFELYSQCTDSDSIQEAQEAWLNKIDEEAKERKLQAQDNDIWLMGNTNRVNDNLRDLTLSDGDEDEEEEDAEDYLTEKSVKYDNLGNVIESSEDEITLRYDNLGNVIEEEEEEKRYDALGNLIEN